MASNLAKIAYEAYSTSTGGVSLVSGHPLPVWEALGEPIKRAWAAAAGAVMGQMLDDERAGRLDPITLNPSQGQRLADMGGGEHMVAPLEFRER